MDRHFAQPRGRGCIGVLPRCRPNPDLHQHNRNPKQYDVTNTHFEGLCQSKSKAKRGKNKQKRNDCLQVAVGMAFDEYGFSLAHEVFEGNMSDSKTLERMLRTPCLATTRFPLKDGRLISMRNASVPDEGQIQIYRMLGIDWRNVCRPRKTEING